MSTIRIFTNFQASEFEKRWIEMGVLSEIPDARVVFNRSGRADAVIVLNFPGKLHFVFGKKCKFLNLIMEPQIRNSAQHIFTWFGSKLFDVTLSHTPTSNSKRYLPSPPCIPPHSTASVEMKSIPEKLKMVSAIGSRLKDLPGHRKRTEFLDWLEENPGEHDSQVFGKGRKFIEDKSFGLKDFMYSVAIENDFRENYWTEKISDCFLNWTVPIYAGCPNIEEFFPSGALIRLDERDLKASWLKIQKMLSAEDFTGRFSALSEARSLVMNEYNAGRICARTLNAFESTRRLTPFQAVWTIQTLISGIFKIASRALVVARRSAKLSHWLDQQRGQKSTT
jgi:Glycosyltransferase family 10 (fucosyltransferase) C-term